MTPPPSNMLKNRVISCVYLPCVLVCNEYHVKIYYMSMCVTQRHRSSMTSTNVTLQPIPPASFNTHPGPSYHNQIKIYVSAHVQSLLSTAITRMAFLNFDTVSIFFCVQNCQHGRYIFLLVYFYFACTHLSSVAATQNTHMNHYFSSAVATYLLNYFIKTSNFSYIIVAFWAYPTAWRLYG